MEIQDITDSITNTIQQIFFFPKEWLEWPGVLPYVIIPVALNWYAFYKILERIFGYSKGINAVIALVISFFMVPIAPVTLFFSIATIAFVGLRSWKARIVFFALLISFYIIVLPFLYTVKV